MSQHRRGSIHAAGSSPVPGGHPNASSSSSSSHEVQTRGIPLPGMVPSRSIHGNPMHGNPIHGFVNPLGPAGLVHSPPTHQPLLSGISHHSSVVHQGTSGVRTRPFAFARKRNEKSCGKIAVEDRDSEDHAVYTRQQRVPGGENRSWPVDAFCDVSIAFLFFELFRATRARRRYSLGDDLGETTDIAARFAWKVAQWSCGGMESNYREW